MNSLKSVYDWAVRERLFSIYTTEYVKKVLDFNQMVVAKSDNGWLIRNGGTLRQLRIPLAMGYPQLTDNGVAGYVEHGDVRYLHLSASDAEVRLHPRAARLPYIISAGGFLDGVRRNGRSTRWRLHSYTPFMVRVGGVSGCRTANGRIAGDSVTLELKEGRHEPSIICP